jgi:hypothetical protein
MCLFLPFGGLWLKILLLLLMVMFHLGFQEKNFNLSFVQGWFFNHNKGGGCSHL